MTDVISMTYEQHGRPSDKVLRRTRSSGATAHIFGRQILTVPIRGAIGDLSVWTWSTCPARARAAQPVQATQFAEQPRAGQTPLPLNRSQRAVQHLRSFRFTQPAEEAQLHELTLPFVDLRQLHERL